jgi:hypothetical protein
MHARVERVFSVIRAYKTERAAHTSNTYLVANTMVVFNGRERAKLESCAKIQGWRTRNIQSRRCRRTEETSTIG